MKQKSDKNATVLSQLIIIHLHEFLEFGQQGQIQNKKDNKLKGKPFDQTGPKFARNVNFLPFYLELPTSAEVPIASEAVELVIALPQEVYG